MIELININRMHTIHKAAVATLSNVNLEFSKNELCCIVGKTKSGKTTLLNILALNESPSSGKVIVDGKDVDSFSEKDKNKYRRSYVSRITQFDDLIPELTVFENCYIATDPDEKKPEGKRATDDVFRALDAVGLSGYENRRVKELNPAEKKRLSIARAISQNVKVLLCDEPTWNLDPESGREIMKLLVAISSSVCVIVATNNIDRAEKYADRIIDLRGGMVISDKENEPTQSSDGFKITLPLAGEPFRDKSRYNKKCTRNAYFKIIRGIIRGRWEMFILVCGAMAVIIGSVITMASMSLYNYTNAVTETFIYNDLYFIPLVNSTSSDSIPGKDETHAAILNDHPGIKIADSYTSVGSLMNMRDENGRAGTYFVVVEDYSAFSLPLIRGSYPDSPNEILISKSTAETAFDAGYIKDMQVIEGFIGRTVQLSGSGLNLKIVGIYESDEPGNERYEGEYDAVSAEMAEYYGILHGAVYAAPGLVEYAADGGEEIKYTCTGLLLCGNFKEKAKALSGFLPGNVKDSENDKYLVNSPVEKAVYSMDRFLTATSNACSYFRIIVGMSLILAMIIYMLVAGRRNMKNIGVLRMIGKPPFLLILENGFFAVFIEALCLGLANLVGKLFIARINAFFSFESGSVLSLFNLNGITSLIIMVAMVFVSGVSSLVLYFIIRTKSPYNLIISN